MHSLFGEYSQGHKPERAAGHAMRPGSMYPAMADVTAMTGNKSYLPALEKIWENVDRRKTCRMEW